MSTATEAEQLPSDSKNNNNRNNARLVWVLVLVLIAGLLASAYWWMFKRHRVATDNAYVAAENAIISSRVPGSIERILVANDDFVSAGRPLLVLDAGDYLVELERRRAVLAQIEAELQVSATTLQFLDARTAAQLDAAEAAVNKATERRAEAEHQLEQLQQQRLAALADLNHARKDADRYRNLFQDGAGSEQQRDRAGTALKKAAAGVEGFDAQSEAARSGVAAIEQDIAQTRAQQDAARSERLRIEIERGRQRSLQAKVAEAQAEVKTAELNVAYCTITAPIAGYVTQKRAQLGERVQPGQALLALVPLQDVYVEANFKETQLDRVRIGQPAEIRSDIYPDRKFHGTVVGIRAGTGAAFSLLPPENATGNWIKVVQRVPMKIRFDHPLDVNYPLRVGLSLEVTINTEDQSGPRLRAESAAAGNAGANADAIAAGGPGVDPS
ncbi:MAG: hypothetical protein AUK55_12945 [Syntrophobacteraceae bacterium CG2_30_61_12]|nr:MAG: hypothetical protein AUK55_12945 [Syntrophobacteraceae bacterium CG2_30_61_12]